MSSPHGCWDYFYGECIVLHVHTVCFCGVVPCACRTCLVLAAVCPCTPIDDLPLSECTLCMYYCPNVAMFNEVQVCLKMLDVVGGNSFLQKQCDTGFVKLCSKLT